MPVGVAARSERRQRRENVRAAVRDAMLRLIESTPITELTINEIASAAGLSRSAFYFYFHDKNDLLMAAADEVSAELYREADRWWHGEGQPEALVREALSATAAVWARHAGLLRATVEVSTYDAEVGTFWRAFVGRFVDATAEHLRRERGAGRLRALDPGPTAEALVWMTERCFHMQVAVGGRTPADVVEELAPIWVAALYPDAD